MVEVRIQERANFWAEVDAEAVDGGTVWIDVVERQDTSGFRYMSVIVTVVQGQWMLTNTHDDGMFFYDDDEMLEEAKERATVVVKQHTELAGARALRVRRGVPSIGAR